MKRIADTIKEVQYRRLLKHAFEPRKDFLEHSREVFLSEVAKRRVAPYAPRFAWHTFGVRALRYSVALSVIALIGTSGLVAYADTTNVGVESPLYPLKRVGEQVRLTVAPANREPELHKELAQRRASEFAEIESKKRPDDDGDVKTLRALEDKENKLRAEFRKSIEEIEEYSTKESNVAPIVAEGAGLCQAAQMVERNNGNGKSEAYKKFEDRCKELLDVDDDEDDVATSTLQTTDDDLESKRNDDRRREDRNEKRIQEQ